MRAVLTCSAIFLFALLSVSAQEHGFAFGKITLSELDMNSYPKDTSASAVVLKEFGHAYIDSEDWTVQLEYHVKIKILKQDGIEQGNVLVVLHRQAGKEEGIKNVVASSFNFEGGRIAESKLSPKEVFKQEVDNYTVVQRFAIPNVKVGSVIEYKYTLTSPWLRNFRTWEFQEDIPKSSSEFWATIPPYYTYNISLRGFLKLSTEESEILRNGFSNGAGTVDCSRMKYAMKDIPAFVEEKYMTAPSNYKAAVNFELLDIRHPDGRVEKITTEWTDAMDQLAADNRFGVQLRRAKNILGDDIAQAIVGVDDPIGKAKRVYDFVKQRFEWNGVYGIYSEHGLRKAMDLGKGNVGDINLTLVAGLVAADLNAEPVILSTRANGFPIELHPVLTDFNYVIARLVVDGKTYLLDATDDFLPFGLIPAKCINGKGRVVSENSSWQALDAPASLKSVSLMNVKVLADGTMSGHMDINYYNYEAVDQRKELSKLGDDQAYLARKMSGSNLTSVSNIVKESLGAYDKPLVIKFDFEGDAFDASGSHALLTPFLFDAWKENPFRSTERLYPVDFGIPLDQRSIMIIELPANYHVKSVAENVGVAMPNAGGRYIYQAKVEGSKVTISSNLVISRTFYTADEYHFLKELFSRVLQTQSADLVIEKR